MPVSIRLSRIGTKHKPFYRMVAVDSRKKRDGASLEVIGTYDGLKDEFVTFKPERFEAWVAQGAQPSDTAKKLYREYKKHVGAGVPGTAVPKEKPAKQVTKKAEPKKEVKAEAPVVKEKTEEKSEASVAVKKTEEK